MRGRVFGQGRGGVIWVETCLHLNMQTGWGFPWALIHLRLLHQSALNPSSARAAALPFRASSRRW